MLVPRMAELMQAHQIPGAAIAVTQADRIVLLQGFGVTDLRSGEPVDPEASLFRVASLSKPFVWMSVLQLRDAGQLDLDADINLYLDFTIPDDFPGQPVTLRHLMSHSAGFEDVNIGSSVRSAAKRETLRASLMRMRPKRVDPPGRRTAYSNYGAALAAYIVENVSGTDFPDHLHARLLAPLGLEHSSMHQPPRTAGGKLVTGHTRSGEGPVALPFQYMNLYPNGAMSASAADMAEFAIANLTPGGLSGVLSQASRLDLHERRFSNIDQGAGLTFGFMESRWNGQRAIGHDGDIAGYRTHFVMFPESRIGLVILFNTDASGNAGEQLIDAFSRHFLPAGPGALFADGAPASGRDDIAGVFVPSRRNHSGLEKLFWPMALGLRIDRPSPDQLEINFQSRSMVYVRRAAGLYMPEASEAGPGALLAWQDKESGRLQLMFSGISAFVFERPPAYESLALHGVLLPISLAGLLLAAGLGVFNMLTGAGRHRLAGMPVLAGSACLLVSVFLIAAGFTPDLVYGVPAWLRAVFFLPLLGGAVIAAAALAGFSAWRRRAPAWHEVTGLVLAVMAGGLLLWQFHVWNMLGQVGAWP